MRQGEGVAWVEVDHEPWVHGEVVLGQGQVVEGGTASWGRVGRAGPCQVEPWRVACRVQREAEAVPRAPAAAVVVAPLAAPAALRA